MDLPANGQANPLPSQPVSLTSNQSASHATRTSIRPLIFLGPEGETSKGEAEGVEVGGAGGLRGAGVGVDRSLRGVGVGGTKGSQGVEGRGLEDSVSASYNSTQSDSFWVSESFSIFFSFFTSFDRFFI